MNTVSYTPSRDELYAVFQSAKKKSTKKFGHYKFQIGDDGAICAIYIGSYLEELKEFKNKLNTIQLGGIWKGVKVSDKDIKEIRKELFKKLEARW
jgi:N-acetylglucosamine kinase-like BadF-type ATPase